MATSSSSRTESYHQHIVAQNSDRTDILAMEVSPHDNYPSYYRILIGTTIKYLTINPGIFGAETLRNPPDLFASLPPLPYGDWNTAQVLTRSSVRVCTRRLPAVLDMWHPTRFEFSSLKAIAKLSARTLEVVHPGIGGSMIAKHARFDWEIPAIEHESRIYRIIDGQEIAPEFVGHLCENGRIIGFLLRKVRGSMPGRRDVDVCESTLAGLHALGILHGGIRKEEFVIGAEGCRVLDFERSVIGAHRGDKEREMVHFREVFREY